jgi:saccharopine dehydrogenase-like NADP-dependent oxidoreductase
MGRVLVLGGGGGVGSVAVRALHAWGGFDGITVADLRREVAEGVAGSLGSSVQALAIDVTDRDALVSAMRAHDIVLNCVGPFYRFGPPILDAAIEAGTHYVDICDDLQPTETMLAMDERAKQAGISALVGMGNSPGLANLFVALCAQGLLDEVESADILHIHGGEAEEGPAVIKHRIHAMTNDIPLFVDGEMIHVRQLEESGAQFVRDVEFRHVGTYPVYPYPHPETITLPRFIPGLRRATNLGSIFPRSYFGLTQDMVRVGACTEEPIEVQGRSVVPLEFSVAHIISRRADLLKEAGVTGPAGCLRVEVSGRSGGEARTFVFQISSTTAGAGEGTGIPAAAGAALMSRGGITRKGVFPPEVAAPPFEILQLALSMNRLLGAAGGDAFRIEQIDAAGQVTVLPLPF